MESYVILGTYTAEGVKNIGDLRQRVADARQAMEAAGARLISYYLTFGEYDFVSVIEVPDTATGARLALALGQRGNIRTHTMRALTEEEAYAVAESLR